MREKKTVEVMIRMYCDSHHPESDTLCGDCDNLLKYAHLRLDHCPLKDNKPTCAKCPIHCYVPSMRRRITQVMKYSGPRMLFKHPVLAITHLRNSGKGRMRSPTPRHHHTSISL